jgi:hypothetical protein
MTNDVEQLERGIHSIMLHIYELFISKGFTEEAAKRELVKVLMRELWRDVDKNDPKVSYILHPICSPSLLLLSKDQAARRLFDEFKLYYEKGGNANGGYDTKKGNGVSRETQNSKQIGKQD